MTKQRPDPDKLANELAGASAFFKRPTAPAPDPAPVSPASASAPAPVVPESQPRNDVTTSPRHDVTTSAAEPTGFDLNRETASRDSLRLSIDETKALDALRASLKWDHDLSVSKNDICRAALHWLLEDFRAKGDKSQAVARLRRKRSSR